MTEELIMQEQPEIDKKKQYEVLMAAQDIAQGNVNRDDLITAMRDNAKKWDDNDIAYLDSIYPEIKKKADYERNIIESAYKSVLEEENDPTIASDLVNLMEKRENWGEQEQRLFYGARASVKKQLGKQIEEEGVSKEYAKRLGKRPPIVRDIALGIDLGRRGLYSLAARPFSTEKATKIIEGSDIMESGAMLADEKSPLGQAGKHVRGASRSIFQAATLSPLGGYGIIGGFALARGNQAITEADKAGLTGKQKWGYIGRAAAIEGSIAGAFQLVGLGGFEKFAAGGITAQGLREFFKVAGIQMAAELAEENITEILDTVNQITTLPQYQDLSDEEKDQMFYNTLKDTTIQTILTMGVTTGYQGIRINQNKKSLTNLKDNLVENYKLSPEQAAKAIDTAIDKQKGKDTFEEALGREIQREKYKTKEGAYLWATNNTDQAAELSKIDNPTRADFEKYGISEMKSEERAEFVNNIRKFVENTGWTEAKAAETELGQKKADFEGVSEVGLEAEAVEEGEKSLPIAKDLRESLTDPTKAVEDLKVTEINQVAEKFGIEPNDVIKVLSEEKPKKTLLKKKEVKATEFYEDRISRLRKRGLEESAAQFGELLKTEGEKQQKGLFEGEEPVAEKMMKARKEATDELQELVLLRQEMEAAGLDIKEISDFIKEQEKVSQPEMFEGPLFEKKTEAKKPKKKAPGKFGGYDKETLRKNTLTGRILIEEGKFNEKSLKNIGMDPEAISESMFRPVQAFGRKMKVVVGEGGITDIDTWAQEFHDTLVNEGVITPMQTPEGKLDTEVFMEWVFDTLADEKVDLEKSVIPKTLADPGERAELEFEKYYESERIQKEAIDEGVELYSGIPKILGEKQKFRPDKVPDIAKNQNEEIERRLQAAHGIKPMTLFGKIKELLKNAFALTRPRKYIPRKKELMAADEHFRLYDEIQQKELDETQRTVAAILYNLGPNQKALFERHEVISNLQESVRKGQPLRFGFKSEQEIEAYLKQLNDAVEKTPEVKKAIENRRAIVKELTQKLVDNGLLSKDAAEDSEAYYHQQVLSYMEASSLAQNIMKKGPRLKKRMFQKKRVEGVELPEQFDYNTDYMEAEVAWMSEARIELAKKKWLDKLGKMYDKMKDVRKIATDKNISEKEVADSMGLDFWQPKPGNVFYSAITIPQQLIEQIQQESFAEVSEEDLKSLLAMGGQRKQFALPKEIVRQLDEMAQPKPEGIMGKLFSESLKSWKVWTLLNPKRALTYNLRNITGDIDPVLGGAMGSLKYIPQATSELSKYYGQELPLNESLKEARDLGVISSTLTQQEIPKLKDLAIFKRFYEQKSVKDNIPRIAKLPAKYFDTMRKYTDFREALLRYSSYLYYKDQIAAGTLKHYGGASKVRVQQIQEKMGTNEAAAHLSRNLLGDYGNLSEFGKWTRKHVIPFFSWMEINTKRVPQMVFNSLRSGFEGGKPGRGILSAAATGGIYSAIATARLGTLYGLMWLWNNLKFRKEEEELASWDRANPHLILGKNEDGTAIIFRNVGALGDFMEWFGMNDLIALLPKYQEGQISGKDLAKEVSKAPLNKVVQGFRPDVKGLFEVIAGQSYFPDVTEPRQMDRGEIVASMFGLRDEYLQIKGKVWNTGERARPHYWQRFIGVSDPRRIALGEMYELRDDFLKKEGKERPSVPFPVSPFKAIRESAYNDDYEAFKEALTAYRKKDKTWKNFKTSLKYLDPIASTLGEENEKKFENEFLTDIQREKLKRSREYAHILQEKLTDWYFKAMKEEPEMIEEVKKDIFKQVEKIGLPDIDKKKYKTNEEYIKARDERKAQIDEATELTKTYIEEYNIDPEEIKKYLKTKYKEDYIYTRSRKLTPYGRRWLAIKKKLNL